MPRKVHEGEYKKTVAFYIQDGKTGLYYVWCYSTFAAATKVSRKVSPGNADDIANNWRRNRASCLLSLRFADNIP